MNELIETEQAAADRYREMEADYYAKRRRLLETQDAADEHVRTVIEGWIVRMGLADRIRLAEVIHGGERMDLETLARDGECCEAFRLYFRSECTPGDVAPERRDRRLEIELLHGRTVLPLKAASATLTAIGKIAENADAIEADLLKFDWAGYERIAEESKAARKALDDFFFKMQRDALGRRALEVKARIKAGIVLEGFTLGRVAVERVTGKTVFFADRPEMRRLNIDEVALRIARDQWKIVE